MSSYQTASRSCFLQVVLRHRGGDRIYEMRCLLVAVGPNAHIIALPRGGSGEGGGGPGGQAPPPFERPTNFIKREKRRAYACENAAF